MKVDIRDKQVLDAIQPSVFAAYLDARGWQVRAESDAHSATFTHHEFEITLPLDAELRDFSIRMSEALRTLEVVEGRDQLAILSDLSPPAERDASVENLEQAASERSLMSVRAGNSVANTSDTSIDEEDENRRKAPRFKIPLARRISEQPGEFCKLLAASGFPRDSIQAVYSETAKLMEDCRRFKPFTLKEERNAFSEIAKHAHTLLDSWHKIPFESRCEIHTDAPGLLEDFISEVESKIRRLAIGVPEERLLAEFKRAGRGDTDVAIEEVAARMWEIENNVGKPLRGEQPEVQLRRHFLQQLATVWVRFHPETTAQAVARHSSEDTYVGPLVDFALSVSDFERITIPGATRLHQARKIGAELKEALESARGAASASGVDLESPSTQRSTLEEDGSQQDASGHQEQGEGQPRS